MRAALLVVALSPALGAQAFVEVESDQASYYLQERIELRIRLGVETAFISDHLIQPFRTPLDLPVRLEAPWLAELPGAAILAGPADDAGLSLVLNEAQAKAPRVADDRNGETPYTTVEITRTYLPTEPGPLQISAPVLRYSHATSFAEDFLSARVPRDRRDAELDGNALTLQIKPLPEEGRPPGFTGAVGRFSVRAETAARDLEVGEHFKLVLYIEGEGNIRSLEAPDLDDLPGFHAFGKIEDIGATRTVTYDLAPLDADVAAVPAIPFVYFDPQPPAGYDTVLTRPIPISVRADPSAVTERTVPGDDDIYDLKPVEGGEPSSISPALVVAVLLVPWLVVLGVLFRRRALTRDQVDPADLRARAAAAEFRDRIKQPATVLDQALAAYLAAQLRLSTAAIIGPQLRTRLAAAGIRAELAEHTATFLDDLLDARFGGNAPENSTETAREIVAALDDAFHRSP